MKKSYFMKINFRKLKIGDRLVREKMGFFSKHHALYLGKNWLTNEPMIAECQKGSGVQIITLRQFLNQGKLVRVEYYNLTPYQQDIINKRVNVRLGKSYDLFQYNCEQFVNDVLTGVAESKQVQNVVKIALFSFCFFLFIGIVNE